MHIIYHKEDDPEKKDKYKHVFSGRAIHSKIQIGLLTLGPKKSGKYTARSLVIESKEIIY